MPNIRALGTIVSYLVATIIVAPAAAQEPEPQPESVEAPPFNLITFRAYANDCLEPTNYEGWGLVAFACHMPGEGWVDPAETCLPMLLDTPAAEQAPWISEPRIRLSCMANAIRPTIPVTEDAGYYRRIWGDGSLLDDMCSHAQNMSPTPRALPESERERLFRHVHQPSACITAIQQGAELEVEDTEIHGDFDGDRTPDRLLSLSYRGDDCEFYATVLESAGEEIVVAYGGYPDQSYDAWMFGSLYAESSSCNDVDGDGALEVIGAFGGETEREYILLDYDAEDRFFRTRGSLSFGD